MFLGQKVGEWNTTEDTFLFLTNTGSGCTTVLGTAKDGVGVVVSNRSGVYDTAVDIT